MSTTAAIRFRTTIELGGKTATGFEVPADAVARLGPSRRPAVRVTIGGYTYRSTVAVMGGRYLVPVSAEHRAGAGVASGDEVDVPWNWTWRRVRWRFPTTWPGPCGRSRRPRPSSTG